MIDGRLVSRRDEVAQLASAVTSMPALNRDRVAEEGLQGVRGRSSGNVKFPSVLTLKEAHHHAHQ